MGLVVAIILLAVLFVLLFILIVFFALIFDLFLSVPYVATKGHQMDVIKKFAKIKKNETIVDLGSGDGRLLILAAEQGGFAIGYEINPFFLVLSRLRVGMMGLSDHVKVKNKNLWQADLKVADVIFVFGKRKSMQRFEDFVWQNSKKGTRILVNMNPFPNKKPKKEESGIFLYTV